MKINLWIAIVFVAGAFGVGYFVDHVRTARDVRSVEATRYAQNRNMLAKELIKIRADLEGGDLTSPGLVAARKKLRVMSDTYLLQNKSLSSVNQSSSAKEKTCFSDADELLESTSLRWDMTEGCQGGSNSCSDIRMDSLRYLNSAKQKLGDCLNLLD